MYDAWRKDPTSVHASWASYFSNLDSGIESADSFSAPSSVSGGIRSSASSSASTQPVSDSLGLAHLIRSYQVHGHEAASLDPLHINAFRPAMDPAQLDYKLHGFTDADLDRKLNLLGRSSGGNTGYLDQLADQPSNTTLRQVVSNLKQTYCQNLGVEYMHMNSIDKCNWMRKQVETPKFQQYTREKIMHVHERLAFADHFEKFLANKFNTAKRFGLEGGESVIPGLKCMIDRGSELGIETFSFGMPHRGRLNTLANVMRKPMPQIFKEFQGTHYDLDEYMSDDWSSAGDVKYHLGTSMDRSYPDGRRVHLSLVANPSHLEAVNPVVIGKIRAKQFFAGDKEEDKRKHMPVLLHGDAAFAGQGIVYETMQMSRVPDFAVGGTIHVIVNNQVGFTTDPAAGRSTRYCSDLGKAFDVPIFHCNGDDPLAVCTAFEMAVEWRQQFSEDCIIDMVCYRRFGHNELDQPMYTQPKMYDVISKQNDTLTVFEKSLVESGRVTADELAATRKMVMATLESEFEASKDWKPNSDDWLSSRWSGFLSPRQHARIKNSGTAVDKLRDIGTKISTIPEKFNAHKQLKKIFAQRAKTITEGKGIDWGTAEALAFGTLLIEGNHVRLTGQDVQRGTFSHRHALLVDQKTGEHYVPLNNLAKHVSPSAPMSTLSAPDIQAEFVVRNSILSEFGVLGFETGYSLENPNTLVLWEAQFGDFVNGAQIMIDQFISAGEDKWMRQSGLTMLLPHGYMGQGAEHSSCRVERFLQQVNEDPDVIPPMAEDARMQVQLANWQVVNCTTPANYYHVLRRQIHRQFRKPLIVVAPKNLLRDKRCTSTLEEMGEGTRFTRLFGEVDPEIAAKPDAIKRLIFCSGKIYYDLVEDRTRREDADCAIVRVEQLAPFPWDKVREQLELYPNAVPVWAQEEPKNMGAWSFVQPRIATVLRDIGRAPLPEGPTPAYAGRAPAAATATGLGARAHNAEQNEIFDDAFATDFHKDFGKKGY
jgi:2-oxoglutarate dehydrogenase E1 component